MVKGFLNVASIFLNLILSSPTGIAKQYKHMLGLVCYLRILPANIAYRALIQKNTLYCELSEPSSVFIYKSKCMRNPRIAKHRGDNFILSKLKASFEILFTIYGFIPRSPTQPYHLEAHLIWCDGSFNFPLAVLHNSIHEQSCMQYAGNACNPFKG
jgi:hypothetical protein